MNLQLALDFTNYDDALAVAKKTADAVDFVEAGTPLIKAEGLSVITRLKKEFPDKMIVADMKTADVGDLEVEMAAKAGADIMTILGACPLETIESGIKKAWELGTIKVAVDLIGVDDVKRKVKELIPLKPDYILVHTGIDEQKAGKDPLKKVISIAKVSHIPMIIAGGINEDIAKRVCEVEDVDIVIVGGAITSADDPQRVARSIKNIIKDY
ncbi:orotidine 5'-phosphate decarboxylase [Patescibacteria group bacterium]|nr:orotidine 5'-phosphate decarboxylase [Patescibacteria group bacterium]